MIICHFFSYKLYLTSLNPSENTLSCSVVYHYDNLDLKTTEAEHRGYSFNFKSVNLPELAYFYPNLLHIFRNFSSFWGQLPFEKGQGHFYSDLACYRI